MIKISIFGASISIVTSHEKGDDISLRLYFIPTLLQRARESKRCSDCSERERERVKTARTRVSGRVPHYCSLTQRERDGDKDEARLSQTPGQTERDRDFPRV